MNAFPKGKFMAIVKVGAKGQIVIPAEVRTMFQIEPGDSLLLLVDAEQGIALPTKEQSGRIIEDITRKMEGGFPDAGN